MLTAQASGLRVAFLDYRPGRRGDRGLGDDPGWRRSGPSLTRPGSAAAGFPQPLPALLQPAPRFQEVPGLAASHQFLFLRAPGIQLLLQHALRVPLLPFAGGGLVPRPHGRLCLHASLRGRPHDPAGVPGQPVLPGPGPHGHASVCVEPSQPARQGQLLRAPYFPGTLPALGTHGLLDAAGQLSPRGPDGGCRWPHLLLLGRCVPQSAWRQEGAADSQVPEAATGCPRGGSQLLAPTRGAAGTPAATPRAMISCQPGAIPGKPPPYLHTQLRLILEMLVPGIDLNKQ
ncbi:derlin-3 isoform X1 [Loxodonta africana]|uniref:derlin-3 isoform X1 n=1 Tax=Loxodonta africana TaxID=9785 RepID=UPI0030D0F499